MRALCDHDLARRLRGRLHPGAWFLPQPAEPRAPFQSYQELPGATPVFHWTEDPVRGHIALCTLAATIKAVVAKVLAPPR